MKTKVKISVSSIKYGNKSPKGSNPDLYINGKSAYTPGLQKQVYTYEKITDHFLCALCEENVNISEMSGLIGIETFERCDRKIAKDMLKLEDSVSLITNSIQDLIDINASDQNQEDMPVSYMCLCLDGEYGVCVNSGLQSAYYYDSINMISMTPMAENPDKLIKMGIISDEQAELVRKDIIKTAAQINVSKMVRLVKDGIFVLMNNEMSGYFDELEVESYIENLREPEQIGNFLMDEAVKTEQEKNYSVTVIKLDSVQSQMISKKKASMEKLKNQNSEKKGEPKKEDTVKQPQKTGESLGKTVDRSKDPSFTKEVDQARTIKVPDLKNMIFASQSDKDKGEDLGMTRKIEPVKRQNKDKNHILAYFSSRIFTIIVIIGVLSGVVIGLVNLASLLFSDNIVPPVYTSGGNETSTDTPKTTSKNTEVTTGTQVETTSSAVTTTGEPAYTVPSITDEPEVIHTVKSGETLSHISLLYYGDQTKYHLIMEANNITNPGSLQIGQKLKIPPLPATSETTGD